MAHVVSGHRLWQVLGLIVFGFWLIVAGGAWIAFDGIHSAIVAGRYDPVRDDGTSADGVPRIRERVSKGRVVWAGIGVASATGLIACWVTMPKPRPSTNETASGQNDA